MAKRRWRAGFPFLACLAAVLVAIATPLASARQAPGLLVFAASSLQTALDTLAPAVESFTGVSVRMSYAASSALARQIENGAPADLFISADPDWMDYLDQRSFVRRESRVELLGNSLVLIAPSGRVPPLRIAEGFPLAPALGDGRLAMAEPDTVPAGKYAQAALRALGAWDAVAGRLASTENVRAALLLVSRGEVPLGIVYRTDALADRGVAIVDTFPDGTHPRIVYPAALTSSARPEAARVLAFLRGAEAARVFTSQGFRVEP